METFGPTTTNKDGFFWQNVRHEGTVRRLSKLGFYEGGTNRVVLFTWPTDFAYITKTNGKQESFILNHTEE